MAFYIDDRNSNGITITYETQKDSLRQAGKNAVGLDRFVYIKTSPIVIKKISTKYVGTKDFWDSKINELQLTYEAACNGSGFLEGNYIETVSIDGGFYIIDGEEFFAGSISEVDFGTYLPEQPPPQFKITVSENSNAAPAGYMPYSNKAFYTNNVFAKQITENSTLSLVEANALLPLQEKYGGVLTAISLAGLKEISGNLYVDATLTYSEKTASISL